MKQRQRVGDTQWGNDFFYKPIDSFVPLWKIDSWNCR